MMCTCIRSVFNGTLLDTFQRRDARRVAGLHPRGEGADVAADVHLAALEPGRALRQRPLGVVLAELGHVRVLHVPADLPAGEDIARFVVGRGKCSIRGTLLGFE